MSKLLEVQNLSKQYVQKSKKQIIRALNGVTFSVDEGSGLGIIGESGCGKSTLAKVLIGLEEYTEGTILYCGQPLKKIIKDNSLKFRRNYQMIYQNPFDTFDPRDNIKNILMTVLKIHNIGSTKIERLNICKNALNEYGMNPVDDFLSRYPHELSGGQLQRISIIRSTLLKPKLIIADEPVSMLDVSVRSDIINMLLKFKKEEHGTIIYITHDIATTRYICDVIMVMYLGKIVEIGKTHDIIHNPQHPYTKVLISNCISINPLEKSNVIKIGGEPPTLSHLMKGCYFQSRCYKVCEDCSYIMPEFIEVEKEHFVSCMHLFDN